MSATKEKITKKKTIIRLKRQISFFFANPPHGDNVNLAAKKRKRQASADNIADFKIEYVRYRK